MANSNSVPSTFHSTLARAKNSLSARRRAYTSGNRALQANDLKNAERLVREAIEFGNAPASWHQRLGFIQERAKKFQAALESYYTAIAEDDSHSEWFYRAGVCAKHLGNTSEACELFENALAKDEHHNRAADALASSIPKSAPGWRRRDLLATAIEASPTTSTLRQAANLAYGMHDYSAAIEHLERIRAKGEDKKADTILLGSALLRTDETERAYSLLKTLTSQHPDPKTKASGPGYYADQRKEWDNAFKLHQAEWESSTGTSAHAAFGAAFALDRQYRWNESLTWYQRALQGTEDTPAYWNYKYAHALERTGNLREASRWYSRALSIGDQKQWDWFFRLGACLFDDGNSEDAYLALRIWITQKRAQPIGSAHQSSDVSADQLERALDIFAQNIDNTAAAVANEIDAALHGITNVPRRELAAARLRNTDEPKIATDHYRNYLRATIMPPRDVLIEVTDHLYRHGNPKEAAQLLLNRREFFRPDGLDVKRLIKSPFDRRRLRYAEYCTRFDVDNNSILFESYWGTRISDNPFALYQQIIDDPRFADYTFYWTHKKDTRIPKGLSDDGRTVLVEYGSPAYDRILATAGTLINNTSFVEYFQRRDDQKYINTWHGTPLKTLGKHIGTGVLEHANVARNFLNATLLAVPNPHTATKLLEDYDVAGITSAEARVTGSPRLDHLLSESKPDNSRTRALLGINADDNRRIVFYAPTWRGSATERGQNKEVTRTALATMSRHSSDIIVFRPHHLVEDEVDELPDNVIIAPQAVDTYDIIGCAEVLVTDYSSLLFDFLATDRMVICYVPDLDEYKAERGLYLDPGTVVSEVARTSTELTTLLEQDFVPDQIYQRSKELFCSYEDGLSGERIREYILTGQPAGQHVPHHSAKKELVFFESMIPNGIRSSFMNLCNLIDPNEYRFTVTLDVPQVVKHPDRQAGLADLPHHVGVIGRTGQMLVTLEERYAMSEFAKGFGSTSPAIASLVETAYRREFRRVFGTPSNATFIDFEGYSRFWNALFSWGKPNNCSSGVFLHNQIDLERSLRFPYLAEIIRNYGHFDGIASVADAISPGNQNAADELSVELAQPPMVVHNSIDAESIISRAQDGESVWKQRPHATLKLVSAARLSPEKNQTLLIDMMRELTKSIPRAELIVLGDGPSASTLRSKVHNSGLTENVHFVGFTDNPMPTIADSDVFVLSSLHEGQPMVIFESMALGVPVVTTPVPGCAEAIGYGPGAVASYDPVDFAKHVIDVASKNASDHAFDHRRYNEKALDEFRAFTDSVLMRAQAGNMDHAV